MKIKIYAITLSMLFGFSSSLAHASLSCENEVEQMQNLIKKDKVIYTVRGKSEKLTNVSSGGDIGAGVCAARGYYELICVSVKVENG